MDPNLETKWGAMGAKWGAMGANGGHFFPAQLSGYNSDSGFTILLYYVPGRIIIILFADS